MTGLEAKKLVPNLLPKEHYVLHYRNLQQYVSLGVEITDVHRVLSFTQHPWMKPYIDTNTDLRKLSTSDFEKDFYKVGTPHHVCVCVCVYLAIVWDLVCTGNVNDLKITVFLLLFFLSFLCMPVYRS